MMELLVLYRVLRCKSCIKNLIKLRSIMKISPLNLFPCTDAFTELLTTHSFCAVAKTLHI